MLASPHDLPHVIDTAIQVGDFSITSSQYVRNLGIVLDQTLSMKQHITHVFIHLRNIRYLKPYISVDALATVAHTFITSCIYYCNSLLVGIPDVCVSQLQRIQNCTARLITNTCKYDHSLKTPSLVTSQTTYHFQALVCNI